MDILENRIEVEEGKHMETIKSETLLEILNDEEKSVDFINNFYEILDWKMILESRLVSIEVLNQLRDEVVAEFISNFGCEFVTNYKDDITSEFVRTNIRYLPMHLVGTYVQLEADLQEKIFCIYRQRHIIITDLIRNQKVLPDSILNQLSNSEWFYYLKDNKYVPMTLEFFKKWESRIFDDYDCIVTLCRKKPLTIEICREYQDKLDFSEMKINPEITDERVKALIAMNLSL